MTHCEIAIIKGDGIGIDVTDAALAVVEAARDATGGFALEYREIQAGAGYFADNGIDIEPGGEAAAGDSDAIFLGAIGLPAMIIVSRLVSAGGGLAVEPRRIGADHAGDLQYAGSGSGASGGWRAGSGAV